MKFFYLLLLIFFINSCSFDNKTGIWKDESILEKKRLKNTDNFIDLNKLFNKNIFNKTIKLEKNYIFKLSKLKNNYDWLDSYYTKTNNYENFLVNNLENEIFSSKKLSRNKTGKFIFFSDDKFIISDEKGNIIIFSKSKNKIIYKFNFFKKKFKNIKKILNIIIDINIAYISDNLGYLYAYDLKLNKLIWAKNYKIPFRSNLKLIDDKLFASNQNNDLLIFSKKSGDILKQIPTEPTVLKNKFINNIAYGNDGILFFLNSYGSLYAIDTILLKVKWFTNLNQSLNLNPSNLFNGNQIVTSNQQVIVSSDFYTFIINSITGEILFRKNFSIKSRPIINNNYLFLITKNNLLISLNLIDGKILYAYSIDDQISKFLKIKKKKVSLKGLILINNDLFVLLNNSFLLNFNIKGKLKKIIKLNSSLNTEPIFINKSFLYLDKKNRLRILN